MTDELVVLARERLERHPVLAAMATRIERLTLADAQKELGVYAIVQVLFDGPALPCKQARQLLMTGAFDRERDGQGLDLWFDTLERDIAAVMRGAGLGGTQR